MDIFLNRKVQTLLAMLAISSHAQADTISRLMDGITECDLSEFQSETRSDGSYSVCCYNSTVNQHGKGERLWKDNKNNFIGSAHADTKTRSCSTGKKVKAAKKDIPSYSQGYSSPTSSATSGNSSSSFGVDLYAGLVIQTVPSLAVGIANNITEFTLEKGKDMYVYNALVGGKYTINKMYFAFADAEIPLDYDPFLKFLGVETTGYDSIKASLGGGVNIGSQASFSAYIKLGEDIKPKLISAIKIPTTRYGVRLSAELMSGVGVSISTEVPIDHWKTNAGAAKLALAPSSSIALSYSF